MTPASFVVSIDALARRSDSRLVFLARTTSRVLSHAAEISSKSARSRTGGESMIASRNDSLAQPTNSFQAELQNSSSVEFEVSPAGKTYKLGTFVARIADWYGQLDSRISLRPGDSGSPITRDRPRLRKSASTRSTGQFWIFA